MATGTYASNAGRRPMLRGVLVGLAALIALACLVASTLHFGAVFTVGSTRIAEPPVLAAAIVEGAIGIMMIAVAAAGLARRGWAWTAAIVGYLFGIGGFVVGIMALVRSPGLRTGFNVAVHAGVLPLLVLGLALTLTSAGREALAVR
jgi:hypothetical protein